MNIQEFIKLIEQADVYVVEDSPYLHSLEINEITGDSDNILFTARWHDDEGQEYEVSFTEDNVSNTYVENSTIFLPNSTGETQSIRLFKLVSIL